jgi:predicted DNA-binding transcriptional regulator AlpA
MPTIKNTPKPDLAARYWRLQAVKAYTQRSRSAIYRDPTFPRPIKLGPGTSAWTVAAVVAWCEARETAAKAAAE